MTLAVGHITYANCVPFFHYLRGAGFRGRIVPGVPARLNALLAAGEIDVSPSSSFEYGRNWRDYLLLPDFSISSRGPVGSVLLFAPGPIEELVGTEIALTGESATSVNLLQILLREFYGFREVRARVYQEGVEDRIGAGSAALLIGDRALRQARRFSPETRIHDLGELWFRHTGLPFVFALWILRREAAADRHDEVAALVEQLGVSRSRALGGLDRLAEAAPEREWMGTEGLIDYWQSMSFDLGPDHLAGLRLYFELAVKYRLLPEPPEIRFFR